MHRCCCQMSLSGTLCPLYWLKSISPLNRMHPWMISTAQYAVQLNLLNLRELAHFKRLKNKPQNLQNLSALEENFQPKNTLMCQWVELVGEVVDQRQCFNAGCWVCLDSCWVLSCCTNCHVHFSEPSYRALHQSAPLTVWESQLLLNKWQAPWGTCRSVLDVLKSWSRRWIGTEKYSLPPSSLFLLHNYPLLQSKGWMRP